MRWLRSPKDGGPGGQPCDLPAGEGARDLIRHVVSAQGLGELPGGRHVEALGGGAQTTGGLASPVPRPVRLSHSVAPEVQPV